MWPPPLASCYDLRPGSEARDYSSQFPMMCLCLSYLIKTARMFPVIVSIIVIRRARVTIAMPAKMVFWVVAAAVISFGCTPGLAAAPPNTCPDEYNEHFYRDVQRDGPWVE